MDSASTNAFFAFLREFCATGSLFLTSFVFAGQNAPLPGQAAALGQNLKAANSSRIECFASGSARTTSMTMADAKIKYTLPRGVTTFIIRLAAPAEKRCFTVVNGNAAAAGKLSIAVSNERLAAGSPKWSEVAGAINFRHKRLFALSLVGIAANYVKLTFQVDDPDRLAQRDSQVARTPL
jgi:hypothetical protein